MDPASLTAAINDRYGSKHTKGSVNGELVRSIKDRVLIRPKFGQYGLPEWEDAIQEIEQMERDVLQEMEDDVGPTPF